MIFLKKFASQPSCKTGRENKHWMDIWRRRVLLAAKSTQRSQIATAMDLHQASNRIYFVGFNSKLSILNVNSRKVLKSVWIGNDQNDPLVSFTCVKILENLGFLILLKNDSRLYSVNLNGRILDSLRLRELTWPQESRLAIKLFTNLQPRWLVIAASKESRLRGQVYSMLMLFDPELGEGEGPDLVFLQPKSETGKIEFKGRFRALEDKGFLDVCFVDQLNTYSLDTVEIFVIGVRKIPERKNLVMSLCKISIDVLDDDLIGEATLRYIEDVFEVVDRVQYYQMYRPNRGFVKRVDGLLWIVYAKDVYRVELKK